MGVAGALATRRCGPSTMNVEFATDELERLETDSEFDAGYAEPIVKAYRKRIQFIRAAEDERDLYAMRSNRFKKLKGNRSSQKSMRLNDQWRLILEVVEANPETKIRVVAIEDYH